MKLPESLQKMMAMFRNFGRPDFDLGSDHKVHEADKTLEELKEREKMLKARLDLLQIRGTPRGTNL